MPNSLISNCMFFLVVFLIIGCVHDPMVTKDTSQKKVKVKIYLEGSAIADVGISDFAVLVSKRDVRELVEIRLNPDSMIFHNQIFNPVGSISFKDIQGLQGVDERLILIGFDGGIIMSYKDCTFGNYLPMTHLEVFDQSCKLSVSEGNRISFLSERGKYVDMTPNALKHAGIRHSCIAACADTVWLGTHGNGLYKLAEGQYTERHAASQGSQVILDDSIVSIQFDLQDNLVVVSKHSVAFRTNSKSWLSLLNPEGAIGQCIASHSDGYWYLGTNQGLFRLEETGMTSCTSINEKLPGTDILGLEIDKDGIFWIGTSNGLARVETTH